MDYCVDGDGNWKTLASNTASESINKGQTLSFRSTLTPASSKGVGRFVINKSCDLTGNCNSLLFGDDANSNNSLSGKNYAFYQLFQNCTTIKNVSSNFLPATTLAMYCYQYMFYNCSSLTTAPKLPATTLKQYCYNYMFYGCSSLATTPRLLATTLANNCYYNMFNGTNVLPDCSNINFSSSTVVASGGLKGLFYGTKVTDGDLRSILPINSNGNYYLPATTLTSNCYESMFYGCKALTTAPQLPATTLQNYCYYRMFYGCSKLTTAPQLPATTLASSCYQGMFQNCSSLTTAPQLPATTLADGCYDSMFYGCSSLTTVPELPVTTLTNSCYNCMFMDCTSLTTAPELPATTLKSQCYYQMFYGCSKLNYIKAMFTTTPSSTYTSNWVRGVASSGTFIKSKNATWSVTGTYGIPSGWTVQTA